MLPSAVLGASMALFLYGYWIRDVASFGDEQMVALTSALGVLAAAGYFLLAGWLNARLSTWTRRSRLGLVLASIPIAAFLLYGGTSGWMSSDRYLGFLLPDHHLKLSAGVPGTALAWFNTSLGDVSYGTVAAQGWKRVGDELSVQDPSSNSLSWTGKIGDRVQMVFSAPTAGTEVSLSWDGQPETVSLAKGKTTYSHAFAVPFYASEGTIMILGFLAVYGLVLGLCAVLWENRSGLIDAARRSVNKGAPGLSSHDLWLVISLCVLAALLRVFNLGTLFPAVDEYYHLIAAKQILGGAALGSVYPRGLWIVTLPVVLALKIFGYQLWAARLIGALFNVLAIIPLYLLARHVNRPVAVLAGLLYTTSPWIITFARVAREYAYYPFYFYWIIYAMILFVKTIPQGFVLARQWRSLVHPKTLVLALILAFPPIFALKIDWLSTFRTILIAYLLFGLMILMRFNWRAKANWPILALILVGVLVSGRAWYLEQSSKMSLLPHFNMLPVEYFLPNPQQQWYLDRVGLIIALAVLAVVGMALLARRSNFIPLFLLALFVGYLAVFALFSKTFFHTRHLLSTELWYVIVVAMGLYAVYGGLIRLLPRMSQPVQVALAAALGLSVLNFGQILLPTLSANPDMPISEDYMHDMTQVQAYMVGRVQPGDVLISTVYGQYTIWEGNPAFAEQFHITSQTPVPDILAFAAQHSSGWIVMDDIRFRLASLSIRDLAGHDQIQYVGQLGDEHVWRWQQSSAAIRLAYLTKGVR